MIKGVDLITKTETQIEPTWRDLMIAEPTKLNQNWSRMYQTVSSQLSKG